MAHSGNRTAPDIPLGEDIPPDPGSLAESLRDFGYTLPTALADLLDNSLTAGATQIDLQLEAAGEHSHIAVIDNGKGMTPDELKDAMRMGTGGPLAIRHARDLGRFGLGLKTASLSQGRCVTVITKSRGDAAPTIRRWDLRHIASSRWKLITEPADAAKRYVDAIASAPTGTAVVIESLDRLAFLRGDAAHAIDHLGRALEAVRLHLSMVFHRFIEDGTSIMVGPTRLRAWNPFLSHVSTKLATETLRLRGSEIAVTPFVLPHHSRLTDEEHDEAAGPSGWNSHQGFFIYRCRRLIVPGTWLSLNLRKEDHVKLARIQVDLPNGLDADWHLNVMKSHVAAPAALRDDFKRIAREVRHHAAEVYRFRGERQAPTSAPPQRFVWKREETKTGVRYRVDRSHPVIRALLHAGCDHDKVLARVIELVEETIPIATMLQERSRAIDGSAEPPAVSVESLIELVAVAEQFLIRAGRSPAAARETVLAAEPFVRYREPLLRALQNPGHPDTSERGQE
ncbi:MAG: ATP-binding protein [Phycisphaerales bacterium]|nr:ATP-binding protein [Phycisphaerales bacterium]